MLHSGRVLLASAEGSGSRRRDPIKFEAGDKSRPSDQSERRKVADSKFSDAPDGVGKESKRPSVFERLQSKVCGALAILAPQVITCHFSI